MDEAIKVLYLASSKGVTKAKTKKARNLFLPQKVTTNEDPNVDSVHLNC